ncbi:MAG: flagellar M-ring protein FliF [Clostridiales bacterium]|nr:flagellar M-ring protein FliF [Clostridiales bacterium]
MKDKISSFLASLKEKWTSLTKGKKITVVVTPIILIVGAIVITAVLNRPSYSVLFSGVSSDEAAEIVTAINNLNVTDVSVSSNGDIKVPKEQEDSLRFQLNAMGYPSTGLNYDIWDNGVDMFSSDYEKREKQRQQLETRISATLKSFSKIKSAIVTLSIPEKANYVINQEDTEPSASVTLTMNTGQSLSQDEINAVYINVQKSSSQLKIENISVVDTDGGVLKYSGDDSDDAGTSIEVAYKRLEFQQNLDKILTANLHNLFKPLYGENGYTISINTKLNYDKKLTEETAYTPSVGEDGMVENEITEYAIEGDPVDGGVVGTTPNADGSPDYPTLEIDSDSDVYMQYKKEVNYLVNTLKTQMQKDGYYIEDVTASLIVNQEQLSDEEKAELAMIVADAIGTKSENVTVSGKKFLDSIDGTDSQIITPREKQLEDYLFYIAISLAALLLILLILYIVLSSSRKKYKKKKSAEPVIISNKAPSAESSEDVKVDSTPAEPEEFQVASLTDANIGTSKEAILKREIGEFSKTNPEIVASLVRNILHNDDN